MSSSSRILQNQNDPGLIEVLFIRHGQTNANAAKIIQGRALDSWLTELGRAQAEDTRDFIDSNLGSKIDILACSSLTRAMQTAAIISGSTGFAGNPEGRRGTSEDPAGEHSFHLHCYRGLDEVSYGELEMTSFGDTEVRKKFAETVRRQLSGEVDAAPEGGESAVQALERGKQALEDVLRLAVQHSATRDARSELQQLQTASSAAHASPAAAAGAARTCVAIVSHGHLLKILLSHISGVPLQDFWTWQVHPGRQVMGNCSLVRTFYDPVTRSWSPLKYYGDHVRGEGDGGPAKKGFGDAEIQRLLQESGAEEDSGPVQEAEVVHRHWQTEWMDPKSAKDQLQSRL